MKMSPHSVNPSSIYEWIPFVLLAALLAFYFWGVLQQWKSGRGWNPWRTAGFIAGTGLLGIAFWPPLVHHGHLDFRVHMFRHLLVGMLAPLGLVLAAPLSLALRTLSLPKARMVSVVLGSRPFHFLSHPLTALVLNIGGMYLLYLTPLYTSMLHNPYLHWLIHFHFFAAGYLFIWAIAGPDPAPRRAGMRLRLIVLFTGTATHAWLSKFMYAYSFPKNTPHSTAEIQAAAEFMYYGGDVAELLLAIAFFSIWYRSRGRVSRTASPSRFSLL